MRTFHGRLWLVEDRQSEVEAEVLFDLDEERLAIISNGIEIGDWSFDEADVIREGNEIHLTVEDEEIVIVSSDIWFASAVEEVFSASNQRERSESHPQRHDSDGSEAHADEETGRADRPSRRGAHRRRGSFKWTW